MEDEKMKKTIDENEFKNEFYSFGRQNQFTDNGLSALYENLIQFEDDCGEEMELDVIALCCDFTEYENLKAFQSEHGDFYESIEDVEYRTLVIKVDDDSFIIQNF